MKQEKIISYIDPYFDGVKSKSSRALRKKELDMNTTSMTGLEIMQAIEQGVIPYPSMAETIPMKFIVV